MGFYEDEADNASADDDALYDSMVGEQWGFTRDLPSNFLLAPTGPQDPLISVMRLAGNRARSWVIQLLPMRFYAVPSGSVAPSAPTNGVPLDADHQTCSVYAGEPRAGSATLAQQPNTPLRLRLQWGVGNVSDTCVIDYPTRGGAIQICAAYVQLYVEQYVPQIAPNGITPRIGGFIVPNTAAPTNDAGYSCRPTYTYVTQTLAAAIGSEQVPIPNRAMAYRCYLTDALDTAAAGDRPVLQQFGSFGPASSLVLSTDDNGTALSGVEIRQARSSYVFPLDSRAQTILVQNTDVATHRYVLQFLLDLGA